MLTQPRAHRYLDLAAGLKPLLTEVDGFISVERFQSLSEPGKVLSLSFWRDEEAIKRWRGLEMHRAAQLVGRKEVFSNYASRTAPVIRDYSLEERVQAPSDSRQAHERITK
ncbi:antibiotic biosynthesis monooxygenase family protein [Pseudomonas azotoformans]|uniref:antibiotic biosynthesis monooxygenase family protein n=1 Tax=Pseudomonas azotoformans TaxID=47878 RepID=UPI0009EEFFCF|nr:antibiotic biosynthesis monooxygenase [Pseudomonas azotoformans]